MFDSSLTLTGHLSVELNGEVVQEIPNLVVTTGKGYVAAAAGDTALGTEAARVALTSTTVSTNTVTYVATFPAGTGTASLTEAGILNGSSGGTLLCRTVFATVSKGSADVMSITWVITAS